MTPQQLVFCGSRAGPFWQEETFGAGDMVGLELSCACEVSEWSNMVKRIIPKRVMFKIAQ